MLPAVTAELPAYLVPPTVDTAAKTTNGGKGSGPAATVELSTDAVRAAQSRRPGVGLYGPDGRFVESASQRRVPQDAPPQPTVQATKRPTTADNSDATTKAARLEAAKASRDDASKAARLEAARSARTRNLSLAQVNAAVPPAQKQELEDLAKRVQRKSDEQPLDAPDYRKIADLMERVGKFDQAKQALDKAAALEKGKTPKSEQASA